jgi:hypothetical protein
MKTLLVLAAGALAVTLHAQEVTLPAPVTVTPEAPKALTVAKVRTGEVTLNLQALAVPGSTNAAITARYQWIDPDGKIVRAGVSRISRADMEAMLGAQGASVEVARLLGMVETVVASVVK